METKELNQHRAFAWGQCKNLDAKNTLAETLRSRGLNVDDRCRSIAVRDCECLTIEFDGRSEAEASIEGSAAALATLVKDVELVEQALRAADIEFWIEITDSAQNRLHYYNNRSLDH